MRIIEREQLNHPQRSKRKAFLEVLVACVMVFSSGATWAQSANWDQTVAAARKEGQIVLYLSITGVEERLKSKFEAAYPGIRLEFFRSGTGAIMTRLDQERATNAAGADAVVIGTKAWYDANSDYLVMPSGPAFDKYWKGSKDTYADGKFNQLDAVPLGIVYNTAVLKSAGAKEIETFQDLLQPQLNGLIGYQLANSPAAIEYLYGISKALGGIEGVRKFAAQKPHAYPNLVPMTEAVASGELGVGLMATDAVVDALAAKGAPVKIVHAKPPIAGAHFIAVVKWAKNPNAAQVFRNWITSPEGQIALAGPGDLWSRLPIDKIPNAPNTMRSIPTDAIIGDGVISPEKQNFLDTLWKPVVGG